MTCHTIATGVGGGEIVQPSQVTAAHVLDAGRRAEANGRVDHAIQFYRHLADHHSAAPEAAAARDALTRLDHRRPANGARRQQAGPTAKVRNLAPRHQSPNGAGRPAIRIAPAAAAEPHRPLALPLSSKGYLIGRIIAHVLGGLGVLLVLAGLAVTILGLVMDPNAPLPRGVPTAAMRPFAGLSALATGIVLLFWSQIARAVFDIARASHDLSTIERAKIELMNERRR